jgi:hypothetical protein
LFGKLLIVVLFFPRLGFLAVLLGLNLVRVLGVSVLCFRLLRFNHAVA